MYPSRPYDILTWKWSVLDWLYSFFGWHSRPICSSWRRRGKYVSHIPIQCAFKKRHSLVNVKAVEKKLHRTLWDSCDRRLFQQVILSSNTACDIQKPRDIDSSVAILQSSLLQAESCAVEKKKIRLCGPKWKASPPVNNILRQRRHLYRKWIQSDKPGPEHPISIELPSLKRELRRTQRKERATERTTFYNSIMESFIVLLIGTPEARSLQWHF